MVELLGKVPSTFSEGNTFCLIHSLLKHSKDRHLESTCQKHLTICSPRNERNGNHSGFGFSNIFLGMEKVYIKLNI